MSTPLRIRSPLAGAAIILAALAGCGREEPAAGPTGPDAGEILAERLRAAYGTSPRLEGGMRLHVDPPDEQATKFSVSVAVDPEVGTVLDAYEKGLEVFDAHLTPDGMITLIFDRPREEVVSGRLAEAGRLLEPGSEGDAVTAVVTRLGTILDELRQGPVPEAAEARFRPATETEPARLFLRQADGVVVTLELDPALERVERKIITLPPEEGSAEGRELLRVTYQRHLVMDGLLRARVLTVELAEDPTAIALLFSEWRVPDSLERAPNPPEVPDDRPHYDLAEWLRALTSEPDEPAAEPTALLPTPPGGDS